MIMDATTPTGASFHRGTSKQNFRTPDDFRAAIVKRFGMPNFDLAAESFNFFSSIGSNVCYFNEQQDSLVKDWTELNGKLLWLNPPFGDIKPWVKKCCESSQAGANKPYGVHILLLIPASVGSNWFAEYVDGKAKVHFLSPRISFDGKAPFPKDCCLVEYWKDHVIEKYECWRWK